MSHGDASNEGSQDTFEFRNSLNYPPYSVLSGALLCFDIKQVSAVTLCFTILFCHTCIAIGTCYVLSIACNTN